MTHFLRTILFGSLLAVAHGPVWAEPVDINRANAETIAANLKGVGPAKAEAIVAYRDANGPFKDADELTLVKGIGPSTVDQNRSDILLEDTTAKK